MSYNSENLDPSGYYPQIASTKNVRFKIGNGGAGITEFVQYMVQKFLDETNADYTVEWVTSDTAETLQYLADKKIDVGWPYGIERVLNAYQQNPDWTPPQYIFRDHFALVGPKNTNPAGLPDPGDNPHPTGLSNEEVLDMFKQLASGQKGAYFLTRDDDSGTDQREKCLFEQATGKKPVPGTDAWYVKLGGTDHYPDAALKEANEKGYYTLTDRGIWTWANAAYKENLQIYCEGGNADPNDILLNSCLGLTRGGDVPQEAKEFVDWLVGNGQNWVEQYKLNGTNLYSKAPGGSLTVPDNPCG